MIGVVADPADSLVVREFFELFKTPWEFCRRGRRYDVLLSCGANGTDQNCAGLVLQFSRAREPDAIDDGQTSVTKGSCVLSYKGVRLPLYFACCLFPDGKTDFLVDAATRKPAADESRGGDGTVVVRIGYDLFREVGHLLTIGQPASNAASATLDLHIALVRDLVLSAKIALVEVPPAPFGYRLIACLTHDVDHPRVRHHKFDHTILGFVYRASIGSLIDLLRGRISTAVALRNWIAVVKLPLVHLGLVRDFWGDFDRYVNIEEGRPSTFFVIPFKDKPGRSLKGKTPRRRRAAYCASDLADQIRALLDGKHEVGLHGIDAWADSEMGQAELAEIRLITGASHIGVRMHWLYFNEESPSVLERAGAEYDTTVGYNETIGFRAGTGQAYRPLNADRLLELPLLIMDTALFYPAHLGLSAKHASVRINEVVDAVASHGGCVTVNWHDRSISPERQWTESYARLIVDLRNRGTWFATASQATAWFRMRRSVTFEVDWEQNVYQVLVENPVNDLPPLTLRRYGADLHDPRDVALGESQHNLVPR